MVDRTVVHLYLAGPEVFAPDGLERAQRMRNLCRAHRLVPISPLDDSEESFGKHMPLAERIFRANIAMIDRADAVVANMNHFRGPDPDAGTSFEVGYGYARGKRCYVYSDDGATAVDRVASYYPPLSRRADGTPIERDDYEVENFGGPYNLMLTQCSTVISGTFADAVEQVIADRAAGLFPARTLAP